MRGAILSLRWVRLALELAIATVLYVALGMTSSLWLPGEVWWVSPVWPPSGLSLAVVRLRDRRMLIAVALGEICLTLWPWNMHLPEVSAWLMAASAILLSGSEVLRTFVAVWLLDRFVGDANPFDRSQDVFRFLVLAGLIPSAVGATIGAAVFQMIGVATAADYFPNWSAWFLSDMAGLWLVAPPLLCWARRPWLTLTWSQALEATALGLCSLVILMVIFSSWVFRGGEHYPTEFLVQPLVLWAVFRFGRRGTSVLISVLTTFAIVATQMDYGPFSRSALTDEEALVLVQVHQGVSGVVAYALAALLHQRETAEAALILNFEEREQALQREVRRLRVEIDQSRTAREVTAITETDYFKELQRKAKALRRRSASKWE